MESGDQEAIRAAMVHLDELLRPHTRSERGLFAVLREDDDFTDHVDSLCSSTRTFDEMLETIRDSDPSGFDAFGRRLRVHIGARRTACSSAAVSLDGEQWERIVAGGRERHAPCVQHLNEASSQSRPPPLFPS